MKRLNFNLYNKLPVIIFAVNILTSSCEKDLQSVVFDRFSTDTFFKTKGDALSAVTSTYKGMTLYTPVNVNNTTYTIDSGLESGELVSTSAGDNRSRYLDFREDWASSYYLKEMPIITEATINMDKISGMGIDENLKGRLIAELKGLRAHYSQMLFNMFGPVPIRVIPEEAQNISAAPIPRPTRAEMVAQIEKDYKEAAAVLPASFTGADYGRFSKGACLTGLMKLYMQEKRWTDAITIGRQIMELGYMLIPNYVDNFNYSSKAGNSEIILAIPALANLNPNYWLMWVLPSTYSNPAITAIEGFYSMPWELYDKFDPTDKRMEMLLAKWPTQGGGILDGRAAGKLGAIPMKYDIDPLSKAWGQGIDVVVYRYADVMLLLAEAINEAEGPTIESHDLINDVRDRAGLDGYPFGTLDKDQFREKIMDERFFELWCENAIRKEDFIRWGIFIQSAIDRGSTYAKPGFIYYPIPRRVISESNGVIEQNPDY